MKSKRSKSQTTKSPSTFVKTPHASDLLNGVELIRLERERQQAEEGWTPDHDDEHHDRELALAAVSYLQSHASPDEWAEERGRLPASTDEWPWAAKWWKPSADPIRNLVKAGALIAAEIDRLRRADTHNRNKRTSPK